MQPQQFVHIQILLQQRRHAEAEAVLRDVLSQDPDNAGALRLMAIVLHQMDREEDALGAINVALRFEPGLAENHAWKSRILTAMHRFQEARQFAEKALELDSSDPFNWTALGVYHISRREWKESEACARKALELDPDDESAHQLLSQSLLYMGKAHENEGNIASRLADDPENPLAHCNAGFAALRRGDHRKASEHFAAALRIDASCEMARDGLIESFRARSVIYRSYLAFSFRMAAVSEKYGAALGLGIYIAYRFVRGILDKIDSRLSMAFLFLYLTFVFWTYVARGLSTFFLLTDRFARQALRAKEKLEALVVGGGFAAGFICAVTGFFIHHRPLLMTGCVLLAQSIPPSVFFEREGRVGRWLYGGFSVITWLCGAIVLFAAWTGIVPKEISEPAFVTGSLTVVICTFCAMFGVAKR